MALVPGLSPNIRLVEPDPDALPPGEDIVVEDAPEGADVEHLDDRGNVIRVEHDDGSITISLDGKPVEESAKADASGWFANLIDKIDDAELSKIADDLIRGIGDDLDSRKDWIEDRAQGIKLLGLKIEVPGIGGAAEGAPVEGMNRVRHPLLLEAVLRFQANARAELLPTDGPVKIRVDDNNGTFQTDRMADALERDLNHYLTAIATEYYPDTDRMLLMLGFGGLAFKKVYFCPLRNRPISETVDAEDLIVNAAATDIRSAKRVTHRVQMRPSTVKRLQILGVYRDVTLSTPMPQELDSAQREKKAQQGVEPEALNPEDRDREIYECYCELNIKGYEHKWKGKESGLEIPWRVTIDVSSKQVLSIVRNYDEDTAELPEASVRAVHVRARLRLLSHRPAAHPRQHDQRHHGRVARATRRGHVRQLPRLPVQRCRRETEHEHLPRPSGRRRAREDGRHAAQSGDHASPVQGAERRADDARRQHRHDRRPLGRHE